jgi:hypothetical protein
MLLEACQLALLTLGRRDLTARTLFHLSGALAFSTAICLLGCTTDKSKVYQGEDFHATGVYSHKFEGSAVATCEAARRALLSQGYIVGEIKADLVNGQKSFQPDPETHVEIAFHVVCVSDGADGKNSTAFVNALQDRYAIKKTPSSASLGVGAVGAVSLPFGSSDDSLVKVASETIPSGPIYDRFFGLTESYLKQIGKDFGPEPVRDKPKLPEAPKQPAADVSGAAAAQPNSPTVGAPATQSAPGIDPATVAKPPPPVAPSATVPEPSLTPTTPASSGAGDAAPAVSGGKVSAPATIPEPKSEILIDS